MRYFLFFHKCSKIHGLALRAHPDSTSTSEVLTPSFVVAAAVPHWGCYDCLPRWFALWPSVFCAMNSLQLTFTFPVTSSELHQIWQLMIDTFDQKGKFGLWSTVCILLSFRTWHWEQMLRGSGWRTPCWCSSQCCSTKTMTTATRSAQSCSISSVSTVTDACSPLWLC